MGKATATQVKSRKYRVVADIGRDCLDAVYNAETFVFSQDGALVLVDKDAKQIHAFKIWSLVSEVISS